MMHQMWQETAHKRTDEMIILVKKMTNQIDRL